VAGPNLKDDGHGWVHVQHAVSRVTNHRHKPIYIDLDMIEISGIITSKCPLCSFSLATTILFYHWESRAGATMKPKIASVNLGWTERERPPKRPTMTGKRPTMTVNRAWNPRNHFSVWKFICYFLRGTATNWLCICSGMSALVAVHCNLERPIRGYDL